MSDDPRPGTLSILAYNTFLLPWYAMPWTKKSERAKELCSEHLPRFDIACLTEVWSDRISGLPTIVANEARLQAGHRHCERGKKSWVSLTDGGLMTTSKIQALRSDAIIYTSSGGLPDSLVANGCLYTEFEMGPTATKIHIFSTHANSDTRLTKMGGVEGINRNARRKQFKQLKEFMKKMIGDDTGAVVLCGDLNINSRCESGYNEYKEVIKLLELEELWLATESHEFPVTLGDVDHDENGKEIPYETLLTQSGDYTTKLCLDYIWFRPDAAKLISASPAAVEKFLATPEKPYRQLSDHYGVSTVLRHSQAPVEPLQVEPRTESYRGALMSEID